MHCQLPFVSHVLAGRSDLSQEQAEAAARFFGLSSEETEFFLLLVSHNRSGTPELRKFLGRLLDERTETNRQIKAQLKIKDSLNPEDQMRYYSHWIYAATHIALTIPELRTRSALSARLRAPEDLMSEVLEFLVSRGFATKEGAAYLPRRTVLHLERTAPALKNHHANWRHRAIESLVKEGEHDLHYSGVLTCSRSDLPRLREHLLHALSECIETLKPSPEEELTGLCIDLFSI